MRDKLIDLLDERSLTAAEVRPLLALLFGEGASGLPHPDLDPRAFASGLAALQRAIGPHKLPFNPMVGRRTPWVDEGKLHRAISAHKGGCAIA